MRGPRTWIVMVVLVALAVAVLAPTVFAGAMAPDVTLKGPSSVRLNATMTLSGTVLNTNGGDGAMYVVIQKRVSSSWKNIAHVRPLWMNGPKGHFAAKVKATDPAMSLLRYRAVWQAGGVKGYSKTLIIAVQ
jgi:hypothetical protein